MASWDFCDACNGGKPCYAHDRDLRAKVETPPSLLVFSKSQLKAELKRREAQSKKTQELEQREIKSAIKLFEDKLKVLRAKVKK